jgi:hypothetical protein
MAMRIMDLRGHEGVPSRAAREDRRQHKSGARHQRLTGRFISYWVAPNCEAACALPSQTTQSLRPVSALLSMVSVRHLKSVPFEQRAL